MAVRRGRTLEWTQQETVRKYIVHDFSIFCWWLGKTTQVDHVFFSCFCLLPSRFACCWVGVEIRMRGKERTLYANIFRRGMHPLLLCVYFFVQDPLAAWGSLRCWTSLLDWLHQILYRFSKIMEQCIWNIYVLWLCKGCDAYRMPIPSSDSVGQWSIVAGLFLGIDWTVCASFENQLCIVLKPEVTLISTESDLLA